MSIVQRSRELADLIESVTSEISATLLGEGEVPLEAKIGCVFGLLVERHGANEVREAVKNLAENDSFWELQDTMRAIIVSAKQKREPSVQ